MDRQDIDALLIGALYGELTPADEARLAAHLDSHPTDRGALDDLKSARLAVRESRIFELQLDPPQAVSALLLQEAHRRAPKRVARQDDAEKESWFYRFTKMFLAHPAMAAAAMLVLVVGVASMLYVRKGDDAMKAEQPEITMQAEPSRSADTTALSKNEATPAPQEIAAGSGSAADDRYRVDLAENDGKLADSKRDRGGGDADAFKAPQQALERQQKPKKSGALVVTTPSRDVKEIDETPRTKVAGAKKTEAAKGSLDFESALSADSDRDGITSNAATGTATASAGPTAGAVAPGRAATPPRNAPAQGAQPPPPPPTVATKPSTTAPAPKPAAPAKVATDKPAEAKQDAASAKDNLIAWAKGEHKRALSLARTNCTAAAKVVLGIQNKAPDYFAKEVATDRGLKNCQTYINDERNAEAERANKSRAQKRPNADEPAAESVR